MLIASSAFSRCLVKIETPRPVYCQIFEKSHWWNILVLNAERDPPFYVHSSSLENIQNQFKVTTDIYTICSSLAEKEFTLLAGSLLRSLLYSFSDTGPLALGSDVLESESFSLNLHA